MAAPACSNCGNHPIHARGRCHTCYRYWLRTGVERPLTMRRRLPKAKRFKRCLNCGKDQVVALNLCNACYIYQKKHNGKMRPRYMFDKDIVCRTCKRPLKSTAKRGSRCYNCDRYFRINGKSRPKELWGDSLFGWCMCGKPAHYKEDGFPLCENCYKEYIKK